ncbi:hypothetical protein [Streptomyces sp. NPDC093225]|uniref:hypothetical protein n=1 Tax=Streptomyces sp. NPDC093225 TaxID=3366034 RepID=UPI003820D96B
MSERMPETGPEDAGAAHDGVRLVARARGRAQVHQVVGGSQHVEHHHVEHHHHYGGGGAAPLGLPELRLWIDRLATDYRALVRAGEVPGGRREIAGRQRELDALTDQLAGAAGRRDGADQLRRLLAAGAARYLAEAGTGPSADPLPEALVVDLAVFALWPVVQAPRLPPEWQSELGALTSPRLAALVDRVRETRAAPDALVRALAGGQVAPGVLALLDDLADPRGAGACLTALALAAGMPPPPQRAGAGAVLGWLLGAGALTALAAEHGPGLAERAWRWIEDEVRGGGAGWRGGGGGGDGLEFPFRSPSHGHGGSDAASAFDSGPGSGADPGADSGNG